MRGMDVSAKGAPVRLGKRVDHEIEKVQGSRFIAVLVPSQSDQEVSSLQSELRAAHPHSCHVCFAYVGRSDQDTRFSDDGEPSKTAGVPMLRVLLGASARQTGALVVRYFGGTKLGTGGLVRAYTTAVREAVLLARWEPIVPMTACRLKCAFAAEPLVRHHLTRAQIQVEASYQSGGVVLSFTCPDEELGALLGAVGARAGGDVELIGD